MQQSKELKKKKKKKDVHYNYCALKVSVPKFKTQHVQGVKKHDGRVTQQPTLLPQNT